MLRDENILENGQLAEQPDILEGAGKPHFGDLIGGFPQGRVPGEFIRIAAEIGLFGLAGGMLAKIGLAVEIKAAVGGGIDPRHHIKGGGFACAVRPDQRNDLALTHLHRKVIHGHHAAELHRNIFQLQNGLTHAPHRLSLLFCR